MSIVDSPEEYAALRDALRQFRWSFLLHRYDATPEDYEQLMDEDLKCEYVDGDLIVHSPASLEHEALTLFVGSLLREFANTRRLGSGPTRCRASARVLRNGPSRPHMPRRASPRTRCG